MTQNADSVPILQRSTCAHCDLPAVLVNLGHERSIWRHDTYGRPTVCDTVLWRNSHRTAEGYIAHGGTFATPAQNDSSGDKE